MSTSPQTDLPGSDLPENIDAAVLKSAGVVVIGSIMSILDITVVNVALPTFQRVFGTGGNELDYSLVGRGKQWFRSGTIVAIRPQIDEQQPIIALFTGIPQDERCRSDHGAIQPVTSLLRDDRIFPPEAKQISMQSDGPGMPLALRPIDFGTLEHGRVARISDGAKLQLSVARGSGISSSAV